MTRIHIENVQGRQGKSEWVLRCRGHRFLALVLFLACGTVRLFAQTPSTNTETLQPWDMPYFDVVPDPIEGFNRCSWEFNDWFFRDVIYPLSFGYNTVVPKPARTGISKMGHNLTYPVRFFNSCFQGKWHGAWEETKRFGVNSTVGIAGFFDPATHWKIGRSEEDFGLTLGHYGHGPGFYLMLPIFGPSNGRDTLGLIVDEPMDICFWISVAYPNDLWAQAIRPSFMFNDLSGSANDYKRELDSLQDPYYPLRMLYSLNRQRLVLNFQPYARGHGRFNPDPTVRTILFKPVTPDFADKAVTRRVLVPATGKKLAYSVWMQKHPAPMVFFLPGLGSYRLDRAPVAYADMLYRHGYSVVSISSPFQQEFMDEASTMAVPGYGPADCDDTVSALKLIGADLRRWKGDRITGNILTGVSHGGYLTLLIAAREQAGQLDGLSFDRYVAVDPPVQLAHAERCLDDMYFAPLKWPAKNRRQWMEDALYKAMYFTDSGLDVSGNLPLTRVESDFLIGAEFRLILMDVIMDSQRRHNLGVLKTDPNKFKRDDCYREIREIGYGEYAHRFVLPYLISRGMVADRAGLEAATDLEKDTDALRDDPKVRVQFCDDDFVLTPEDIAWFRSTFGDRCTEYPEGGHLGNLYQPDVQERLVKLYSEQSTR